MKTFFTFFGLYLNNNYFIISLYVVLLNQ